MIDLLIKLLAPFFAKMGVSIADVTSYSNSLKGYIYLLLILLVVLIAVLVGAHWLAKKGNRLVLRWSSVVAFVMAALVIVNMICYGPMYANVSGMLNASPIELSDDVVANSRAAIQKAGEEGMVLVKNTGILPLADNTKAINVFGWDSVFPLYGGVGSGASDASDAISILQSLEDAGFSTNGSLSDLYRSYCSERPAMTIKAQDWTLPEPPKEKYTDELIDEAKSFSDTAMIVLGRSGGEGADLPTDMNAVIKGTYDIRKENLIAAAVTENYGYTNASYTNNGGYDDFAEGETYLDLSRTERDMIDLVCDQFEQVIVVINSANAMNLSFVDEYDAIGAVILAPGAGATGMEALGQILNGSVNPSGRTVDTFVKDFAEVPSFNNIGNFSWNNVDDLKDQIAKSDAAYEGNLAFVDYAEGIYVGYKYFETASEEGAVKYDDIVQYPFGYGLSYTSFEQEISGFDQKADTVTVKVKVTNTGDVSGKDVVELYFTPPYNNGGIEKASVNLLDFGKTSLLEPGKSEDLSFVIPIEEFAAYDGECLKTENGGYILEEGTYTVSVRSDSHTVIDSKDFTISEDRVLEAKDGLETPENLFDYAKGDREYLSRKDSFANLEQVLGAPSDERYHMDEALKQAVLANTNAGYDPKLYDEASDEKPTTGADNGLMLKDLTGKSYDDERWEELLDELSVDDMITLINIGGWQTSAIESIDKMATTDCDGPAGLANFVTKNYGTSYPSEVLMAQTWSKEMAAQIGDAMGQEYAAADNYGWYGPAMNIHRSPFAGRNFEYYSEDSVFSGKFASEQVNGAAKWGVYPYIKHFALNDQETNRESILMTYAPEQAIREIYLKPFGTVISHFDSDHYVMAVMSSYNWIGEKPACADPELLQTVLRDEWGYRGMVISDYNGSYGYMNSDACVRNGNDLMLGFGRADSNQFKDRDSATLQLAMRQSCKNILYTVANSGYYKDASAVENTDGMDRMTKLFLTVDLAVGGAALLSELLVLILWLKKRKKANYVVVEE